MFDGLILCFDEVFEIFVFLIKMEEKGIFRVSIWAEFFYF
jgi:hypothetical protein